MIKSELVARISEQYPHLYQRDVLPQPFFLFCHLVVYPARKAQNAPFGTAFLVWVSPL